MCYGCAWIGCCVTGAILLLPTSVLAQSVDIAKQSTSQDGRAAVPAKKDRSSDEVVARLTKQLRDDNENVVYMVAISLIRATPHAADILVRAFRDPKVSEKQSIVAAFALLGPKGKQVIPLITPWLNDLDWSKRKAALYALGRVGPSAVPALSNMVKLLKTDDHSSVRTEAAIAIGRVVTGERDAVLALSEALSDSWWTVRREAASSLGRIGPAAKLAIPELQQLMIRDHDCIGIRTAAKQAIESIRNDRD